MLLDASLELLWMLVSLGSACTPSSLSIKLQLPATSGTHTETSPQLEKVFADVSEFSDDVSKLKIGLKIAECKAATGSGCMPVVTMSGVLFFGSQVSDRIMCSETSLQATLCSMLMTFAPHCITHAAMVSHFSR